LIKIVPRIRSAKANQKIMEGWFSAFVFLFTFMKVIVQKRKMSLLSMLIFNGDPINISWDLMRYSDFREIRF
jgi:hypothetical protein